MRSARRSHWHPIVIALVLSTLTALHAAEVGTIPAWGDQGDGTYRNPVVWADFNNPCVFKAGETFYLTCASHHFMGMPLLVSKDLVNWTHAGRIFSRLGGLHADFTFPGKACSAGSQDGEVGFFGGTYYMFNWSTRYRGFVCRATAPLGPWSEACGRDRGRLRRPVSILGRGWHWLPVPGRQSGAAAHPPSERLLRCHRGSGYGRDR
ncbi:MAG: hypothetical protein EBR86_06645 [Planctomycetia bacterium]|nr:hypothetical protein [Planctomycetia bacterium]